MAPPILVIAVAASMMGVMTELKDSFHAQTGVELRLVSGASGKFTTQISNGAPFDAFVSADVDYPERLHADGLAGDPYVYGRGVLVVWSLRDVDVYSLAALKGARKLAIADPKTAPYGRAAVSALKAAGVYEAVEKRLVFGESIGQTNQFILSKAADAGITAKSTVIKKDTPGRWAEVDPKLYSPIRQALVGLEHGRKNNPKALARFLAFMKGGKARMTLKKYGYLEP